MEKKKYEVTIADVEMAIISDEREEFVMRLVSDLDQKIRDITLSSKRCSKLDAAILVALDTSSEKIKGDKRIRNLEAQIGLYDANLRRLREENAKLKAALLDGRAAAAEAAEEIKAAEAEAATEAADDGVEQLGMTELVSPVAEEPPAEAAVEEAPAAEESRGDKLRQIENLLRGRNNG